MLVEMESCYIYITGYNIYHQKIIFFGMYINKIAGTERIGVKYFPENTKGAGKNCSHLYLGTFGCKVTQLGRL
jgi:hypothetical protein